MADVYVVNLREAFKAPRQKRAAKAARYLRSFVAKHVKKEDVRIDTSLNEKLWARGIENPPHKLKIKVAEQEDGSVLVSSA